MTIVYLRKISKVAGCLKSKFVEEKSSIQGSCQTTIGMTLMGLITTAIEKIPGGQIQD